MVFARAQIAKIWRSKILLARLVLHIVIRFMLCGHITFQWAQNDVKLALTRKLLQFKRVTQSFDLVLEMRGIENSLEKLATGVRRAKSSHFYLSEEHNTQLLFCIKYLLKNRAQAT